MKPWGCACLLVTACISGLYPTILLMPFSMCVNRGKYSNFRKPGEKRSKRGFSLILNLWLILSSDFALFLYILLGRSSVVRKNILYYLIANVWWLKLKQESGDLIIKNVKRMNPRFLGFTRFSLLVPFSFVALTLLTLLVFWSVWLTGEDMFSETKCSPFCR
jgi:hypothetical protein